jgi:hypothetical protein
MEEHLTREEAELLTEEGNNRFPFHCAFGCGRQKQVSR